MIHPSDATSVTPTPADVARTRVADTFSFTRGSETASHAATGIARTGGIDIARGIGIVLVVIGHACGGIIDANYGLHTSFIRALFLAIYSFHMPFFFILSGLFVVRRLKKDPTDFLLNLPLRIARPYFIWSALQLSVIYMMGAVVSHPETDPYWPRMLAIAWEPVSQYWFLYTLFFAQLGAYLIVPRAGAAAFVLAAALLRAGYETLGLPHFLEATQVESICRFAVYFSLGVCLGPMLSPLAGRTRAALLWLGPFAWAALLAAGYTAARQQYGAMWLATSSSAKIASIDNSLIFIPAALVGALLMVLACSRIQRPLAVLEYLGRQSMPIFLTHILFIAGARIVLIKLFKGVDVGLLLISITACGLMFPLLFLHVAKRLKIDRILALS